MRLIGKFEIKEFDIVKGINFEGVRKIGNASETIKKILNKNDFIEEVFLQDIRASLYDMLIQFEIVEEIVKEFFLPVCVGGGIKKFEDVEKLISLGCERVSINSCLEDNFDLINKIANHFGSQSISVQLDVVLKDNKIHSFKEYGRELRTTDIEIFLKKCIDNGVGEICMTAIENDGKMLGPNLQILDFLSKIPHLQIIYGGGIRGLNDIEMIKKNYKEVCGVCFSSFLYSPLFNDY